MSKFWVLEQGFGWIVHTWIFKDDHFSWLKISALLVKNEHFNRTSTSKNKIKLFEKKKSKILNKKWDKRETRLLCVLKMLLSEILFL